jgi:hypothetical protein
MLVGMYAWLALAAACVIALRTLLQIWPHPQPQTLALSIMLAAFAGQQQFALSH